MMEVLSLYAPRWYVTHPVRLQANMLRAFLLAAGSASQRAGLTLPSDGMNRAQGGG